MSDESVPGFRLPVSDRVPATGNRKPNWIWPAEATCLAVFFAWLFWLPLPFGSVTDIARAPLVLVPLGLCAVAATLRLAGTRDSVPFAQRIWTGGAALFLAVGLLQLVPLPPGMLAAVSPESHAIWTEAAGVAALFPDAPPAPTARPVTVNPGLTAHELFRLAALFATFQTAALLVRGHKRRLALAAVLCGAALFEILYGVREAALDRYAIWGWRNTKIFDRVTGTFVNPNHFAHYVGIILPLALFLGAAAWRSSAVAGLPFRRRLLRLIEKRFVLFGFSVVAAVGCVAAILVAQSRGGLLAIAGGFAVTGAIAIRRRERRTALLLGGIIAAVVLVAGLVAWLGRERTVARFKPLPQEELTLVGRRIGIEAAAGVWNLFPLLGSGLGTFPDVVSMTQDEEISRIYHHAHNDYVEIAATAGTAGFVVAIVALLGGYVALMRLTFGGRAHELSARRRIFQAAALTSLTIAMVHALFDFNFFIPANPATLAAILGAAVSEISAKERYAPAAGSGSA